MKLKLIQAGYTTFTGRIGVVNFVNGTSEEISVATAAGIAKTYRCERIDGVTNVGVFDVTQRTHVKTTAGDFDVSKHPAPLKG